MATKILKVLNDINDPSPRIETHHSFPVPMPISALATYALLIYAFQNVNYRQTIIIPSICKCPKIQHVRIHFGRWGDCVEVTRTHGLTSDAVVNVKGRELTVQYCLRKRVRNEYENA